MSLFFKIEIVGQENAKTKNRPLVLVSNHKSYIDHFLIAAAFPENAGLAPIRIMATYRFMEMPVVGRMLAKAGCFSNKGTGAFKTPFKFLKEGGVVGLYPEGKIHQAPGIYELGDGAPWLALKSAAWILPITISGLENFSIWKTLLNPLNFVCKRKILVSFGNPIQPPCPDATLETVKEKIRQNLESLYQINYARD